MGVVEELLRAAGVDLGVSYPHRVVLMSEVQRSVAHACQVLEQSKTGPDQGPFRFPTRSDPSRPSSLRTGTHDDAMNGPLQADKLNQAASVGCVQSHISETDGCHESTAIDS